MNDIDISICIVSYNHENYICKAIDSALSQKCKYSFEIIIGDDCSTDRTVEVIRKNYGDKVSLIARRKNLGLSKNIYDINRRAKGKVIFSLAGDDWIIGDNTIEKCYEILENKPEISCVSGWSLVHNKEEKVIDIVRNLNVTGYSLYNFLWGDQPHSAIICYRNTFWETDNEYLYKCSRNNEEMAWWFYLLNGGDLYVLQECIYGYRFVNEEGRFNYNSLHDGVEIFYDYYIAIKRLQKKFRKEYNFSYLLSQTIYTGFLGLKNMTDLRERKEAENKMKKIITNKDYIHYLKCLPILTVFHGYYPMKFRKLAGEIRRKAS